MPAEELVVQGLPPIEPPAPALSDGSVLLRPWTIEDVPACHRAVQDPEIWRFTSIPVAQTVEGVERWISTRAGDMAAGRGISLAVTDAEDGTVLGSIGVERSCDDPEVANAGDDHPDVARCDGVVPRPQMGAR